MPTRSDGRQPDQLRSLVIAPDCSIYAEGSVLIECGSTRVMCTASVDDRVPPFRRGTGSGWVTSEYGMLPRSTSSRMIRESSKGRPSGRTQEIQRIIGRALRSVVDLDVLGERTIWIDCDVLQADGGTRTASITGSFVALALATERMRAQGQIDRSPLLDYLAAVSVGVVGGEVLLDLAYDEDSTAEVDMNVVMTGRGTFVEVQGTAEGSPFERSRLDAMLDLAALGIRRLIEAQREVLGRRFGDPSAVLQEGLLAFSSGDSE
ncbi:MAG: ribonuclease PH [Acidobacteriota bacterium]|jgi:ribonuclease PH